MKQGASPSLTDPVHDYVLTLILNGSLQPGQRISESAIAEACGVSRTPVRSALRQLESEGVVIIRPNRFVEVSSFDEEAIRDIGIMRIALESVAIKLAIFNGSNAEFRDLRQIARNQDCLPESDPNHLLSDISFHQKIIEIARSELLLKYFHQLSSRAKVLLTYSSLKITQSVTHSMMAEAISKRDEEASLELMRRHIGDFYRVSDVFCTDIEY